MCNRTLEMGGVRRNDDRRNITGVRRLPHPRQHTRRIVGSVRDVVVPCTSHHARCRVPPRHPRQLALRAAGLFPRLTLGKIARQSRWERRSIGPRGEVHLAPPGRRHPVPPAFSRVTRCNSGAYLRRLIQGSPFESGADVRPHRRARFGSRSKVQVLSADLGRIFGRQVVVVRAVRQRSSVRFSGSGHNSRIPRVFGRSNGRLIFSVQR